jgi:PST family polysaccharide transporter
MLDYLIKLRKSKVMHNGIWLYILQIFNTVIPLLTLPYITRILGSSQFGDFSFALNLVGYLKVIVDYGFDLSGSRKIAMTSDKDKVSIIFSTITYTKLLLFVFSLGLLLIISIRLRIPEKQLINILILILMILGTTIQQTWLFQGLQVMKYITIISVTSRIISVILIFALIKNSNQLYLYSLLYSSTFLFNGILSLLIVRFKLKLNWRKVCIGDIVIELKDGWYIFTTSVMTKVFTGIGVTVLGFTTSSSIVGIYSAIQKIPLLILMIYAPVGQVLYPYISNYYATSFISGFNKVLKLFKLVIPVVIIICLLIIILSNSIVDILFGQEYATFSIIVIPLVVWSLLSIINNFIGIQILVASGHQKEYSIAFRIGILSIVVLNIVCGYFGGIYGVSIAAVLSELTLTFAIIYQIQKIKKCFLSKST